MRRFYLQGEYFFKVKNYYKMYNSILRNGHCKKDITYEKLIAHECREECVTR